MDTTVKVEFKKQSRHTRKSLREEMQIWEQSLTKKYGIAPIKKKKSND